MGNDKTIYDAGGKLPSRNNGHVYGSGHWSDYIIMRGPKETILRRRKLMVNCFDLIVIAMLLKIQIHIGDIKEWIVWIVGFLYIVFRAGIYALKLAATYAKNKNLIRKLCKDFRNNE